MQAFLNVGLICLNCACILERGFRGWRRLWLLLRRLKDKEMEGVHLGNLGLAYFDLGETAQGHRVLRSGADNSREIGDDRGEGAT